MSNWENLWWISHQNKFPRLNLLAQHYLGIPGTSVCNERMFSGAGMVVSARRCRLLLFEVEKLLFLHCNI